MDLDHDLDTNPNTSLLDAAEAVDLMFDAADEAERDLLAIYIPTSTLAADNAALRSVVQCLLEGDVPGPASDGHRYWYGLDQTCCPHYQGRRLTDEEARILETFE